MTMATTIQQIDSWRAARSEHQRLEFKEAKTQFDNRKLYKYCVALANEGGGHLLLGIEDAPPRRVVGTTAFSAPVEMAAKMFQTLGFRVDIEEVSHPDGRVLVFHIPGRPLGTVYDFEGSYLMRAGEELVPMSEDRLRAIFAEGQPDWLSQPAMQDCDDDKVVQLLDTQSYFDLLHLPYPVNRAGVLERFESEKLIRREDGGWSITNLGGMLFAKKLDQFDRLARKAARVIEYEGTNKLKTKTDKPGVKGYAVGFQGLVEFINGLVPSNEVIEQALRREVKMFPEIAVRELVANALIHQDFTESGMSVMVEIYADRMEISNPGKPFISPDRFIDEYQSRNERLADLMRRLGICEEKGSGVDKVIQAAEAHVGGAFWPQGFRGNGPERPYSGDLSAQLSSVCNARKDDESELAGKISTFREENRGSIQRHPRYGGRWKDQAGGPGTNFIALSALFALLGLIFI